MAGNDAVARPMNATGASRLSHFYPFKGYEFYFYFCFWIAGCCRLGDAWNQMDDEQWYPSRYNRFPYRFSSFSRVTRRADLARVFPRGVTFFFLFVFVSISNSDLLGPNNIYIVMNRFLCGLSLVGSGKNVKRKINKTTPSMVPPMPGVCVALCICAGSGARFPFIWARESVLCLCFWFCCFHQFYFRLRFFPRKPEKVSLLLFSIILIFLL